MCLEPSKPRSTDSKARAPIWHTVLLLLYLLVPVSRWPGVRDLIPRVQGPTKLTVYLFEISFQLVGIAFVGIGMCMTSTPVRELVGKHWTTLRDSFRDIGLGILFWILAIGLSVFTYFVLGASYDRPSRVLPRTSLDLLVFVPFAAIAGFCEEVIFRGYLFNQFKSVTGNMEVALFLQAVVFSAAHGYDQTISGVINNFMFAIAFGILAVWRRSLLPGIIAHVWLDISVGISAVLFP